MNKILSSALAAGILLAGGGVFYHYVFFLPQVESRKAAEAEEKKAAEEKAKNMADLNTQLRELQYKQCISDASDNYSHNWDRSCKTRGLKADCALPSVTADSLGKTLRDSKDRCLAEAKAGVSTN